MVFYLIPTYLFMFWRSDKKTYSLQVLTYNNIFFLESTFGGCECALSVNSNKILYSIRNSTHIPYIKVQISKTFKIPNSFQENVG